MHADPEWSESRLELESGDIAPMLLSALQDALGLPVVPTHEATAHRWRYASSSDIGKAALWNADIKLGVCGDWLTGPHAECAWTSGRALGRLVNATFDGVSALSEKDGLCVL